MPSLCCNRKSHPIATFLSYVWHKAPQSIHPARTISTSTSTSIKPPSADTLYIPCHNGQAIPQELCYTTQRDRAALSNRHSSDGRLAFAQAGILLESWWRPFRAVAWRWRSYGSRRRRCRSCLEWYRLSSSENILVFTWSSSLDPVLGNIGCPVLGVYKGLRSAGRMRITACSLHSSRSSK